MPHESTTVAVMAFGNNGQLYPTSQIMTTEGVLNFNAEGILTQTFILL